MAGWIARVLAAAAVVSVAIPARGAEIRVGLAATASSADPLYHEVGPNDALALQVYDRLVGADAHLHLQPDLATGWTLLDERSWKFDLRPGVVFQDGAPFTASDVVYTFCRALHANDTGSFSHVARSLTGIDVPDAHTVVLHTAIPDPTLPAELAAIAILPRHLAAEGGLTFAPANQCGLAHLPAPGDYDSLRLAIGTGRYRLEKYIPGTSAVLRANPAYFGAKPRWDRVTYTAVTQAGPRDAGLMSGDFDLIENASPEDFPAFKRHGGIAWTVTPSLRMMFLQPDIGRAQSPEVRDAGGRNPLQDPRVRQAISLAIDRAAIASRIMDGLAVPADQYLTPGLPSALPDPPPRPYDPAAARKLLAEAGYPKGFGITLAATSDRYINDAQVAQAVAQFLTRAGIRTQVDAMPQTVFFPSRFRRAFSLSLAGWGFGTGEVSDIMRPFLITIDAAHGLGQSNYGGYSRPQFDALALRAIADMNDATRIDTLRQATRIALTDNALIPLYWETSVWAYKDRFTYTGRVDQMTDADDLRPKP